MNPTDWLGLRCRRAPERLAQVMLDALPSTSDSVADALAAGALGLYARVLREGTGGRADALPLLAADALLTHALEAVAELEPERIESFAHRWGPAGRLAELEA